MKGGIAHIYKYKYTYTTEFALPISVATKDALHTLSTTTTSIQALK